MSERRCTQTQYEEDAATMRIVPKRFCIICGVEEGCRKPCCNMGNRVCYGDPYDVGPHIFREVS